MLYFTFPRSTKLKNAFIVNFKFGKKYLKYFQLSIEVLYSNSLEFLLTPIRIQNDNRCLFGKQIYFFYFFVSLPNLDA